MSFVLAITISIGCGMDAETWARMTRGGSALAVWQALQVCFLVEYLGRLLRPPSTTLKRVVGNSLGLLPRAPFRDQRKFIRTKKNISGRRRGRANPEKIYQNHQKIYQ